jgi:predicted nucleotidyltransferase
MAYAVHKVDDACLEKIAAAIVGAVNPSRIVAFGSCANGSARPDSDLDLVVVEEAPFTPQRTRLDEFAKITDALMPFELPIDLLLYSRAEFERWKGDPRHVLGQAHAHGRVIHART